PRHDIDAFAIEPTANARELVTSDRRRTSSRAHRDFGEHTWPAGDCLEGNCAGRKRWHLFQQQGSHVSRRLRAGAVAESRPRKGECVVEREFRLNTTSVAE